jgi:predicted ester cyclase
MSSTEENKAVVRRYRQELMNEGNLNVVDAIFPARFALNGQEMTPESFKPLAAMWRTAFPDMCYTLEHIIVEGDIVAEHWTARGTHRGRLFGIAPTDKHFENMGINIHHIVDGKIIETWEVADGSNNTQVSAQPRVAADRLRRLDTWLQRPVSRSFFVAFFASIGGG